MSIKIQVDDSIFLIKNQRYLGALTNLMLAVAASSRKAFPKGVTPSVKFPNDQMRDGEAFKIFLSSSIREMLFGDYGESNSESTGICVSFRGQSYDLADILYKFYRCELVHEGELPEDVKFVPPPNDSGGVSLSISHDETSFILDYNLLNILIEAVVKAKCNRELFNIEVKDMAPKGEESDAQISEAIVEKHGITPGRFNICKEVVRNVGPEAINQMNDLDLTNEFSVLVSTGAINGSAITGLASHQLSSYEGVLQSKGIEIIRDVAGFYKATDD